MNHVREPRTPEHLRVKALDRQVQQCKICRVRRLDVLVVNIPRLLSHAVFKRFPEHFDARNISAVLRVLQALKIFQRKFRVDGQPARLASVPAAGQANREFDALAASRSCRHILFVLAGRQHLLEEVLELHFAPRAARLDIGQHALQVTDADCQRLHLAQPFVDLLQPVGHLLERRTQALIERGLQFFVDRRAHLLELLCILAAQDIEPLLDGLADRFQSPVVRLREA